MSNWGIRQHALLPVMLTLANMLTQSHLFRCSRSVPVHCQLSASPVPAPCSPGTVTPFSSGGPAQLLFRQAMTASTGLRYARCEGPRRLDNHIVRRHRQRQPSSTPRLTASATNRQPTTPGPHCLQNRPPHQPRSSKTPRPFQSHPLRRLPSKYGNRPSPRKGSVIRAKEDR